MENTTTLFVVSSDRGIYPLDDIVSAIVHHEPAGTYMILAVDETNSIKELTTHGAGQLVHTRLSPAVPRGFHRAVALEWAIGRGMQFQQAILLDDTVILRGSSLGQYCQSHMNLPGVAAVGVGCTLNRVPYWQSCRRFFEHYSLPYAKQVQPPIAFADPFLRLNYEFVSALVERGLLIPKEVEGWPTTYGAYIAWMAVLMDFHAAAWGFTTKALPPFFVSNSPMCPPPHILSDDMILFSSSLAIPSYSDTDIRELLKRERSEPGRPVPTFSPTTFGGTDVPPVM